MRHGNKINHLGRKYGHRRALLANLAVALITNKRIITTVAKAKELRRYIEPLITKAKDNSTHSRRTVFSYLQDKVAVKELFEEIAVKIGDRPGGYVRIIKYETRPGDNAEMAFIEFVDYNEVYTTDKKSSAGAKTKRTRRAGSGAAKSAEPKAALPIEDAIEETDIVGEVEQVAEAAVEEVEPIAEVVEEVVEEVSAPEEEVVVEEAAPIAEVVEEVVEEATPTEEVIAEAEVQTEEVTAEAETEEAAPETDEQTTAESEETSEEETESDEPKA